MKGCRAAEQFHPEGDVFEHTRLMLRFFAGESFRAARFRCVVS